MVSMGGGLEVVVVVGGGRGAGVVELVARCTCRCATVGCGRVETTGIGVLVGRGLRV